MAAPAQAALAVREIQSANSDPLPRFTTATAHSVASPRSTVSRLHDCDTCGWAGDGCSVDEDGGVIVGCGFHKARRLSYGACRLAPHGGQCGATGSRAFPQVVASQPELRAWSPALPVEAPCGAPAAAALAAGGTAGPHGAQRPGRAVDRRDWPGSAQPSEGLAPLLPTPAWHASTPGEHLAGPLPSGPDDCPNQGDLNMAGARMADSNAIADAVATACLSAGASMSADSAGNGAPAASPAQLVAGEVPGGDAGAANDTAAASATPEPAAYGVGATTGASAEAWLASTSTAPPKAPPSGGSPASAPASEDPPATRPSSESMPGPVWVQVVSWGPSHSPSKVDCPDDGAPSGNGVGRRGRGVLGIFYPDLYLTGGECIECNGALMSRGRFEALGGSTSAKWHVSIKVLPSKMTIGRWLRIHGLPLLKGKPRKRRGAARAGAPPGDDGEDGEDLDCGPPMPRDPSPHRGDKLPAARPSALPAATAPAEPLRSGSPTAALPAPLAAGSVKAAAGDAATDDGAAALQPPERLHRTVSALSEDDPILALLEGAGLLDEDLQLGYGAAEAEPDMPHEEAPSRPPLPALGGAAQQRQGPGGAHLRQVGAVAGPTSAAGSGGAPAVGGGPCPPDAAACAGGAAAATAPHHSFGCGGGSRLAASLGHAVVQRLPVQSTGSSSVGLLEQPVGGYAATVHGGDAGVTAATPSGAGVAHRGVCAQTAAGAQECGCSKPNYPDAYNVGRCINPHYHDDAAVDPLCFATSTARGYRGMMGPSTVDAEPVVRPWSAPGYATVADPWVNQAPYLARAHGVRRLRPTQAWTQDGRGTQPEVYEAGGGAAAAAVMPNPWQLGPQSRGDPRYVEDRPPYPEQRQAALGDRRGLRYALLDRMAAAPHQPVPLLARSTMRQLEHCTPPRRHPAYQTGPVPGAPWPRMVPARLAGRGINDVPGAPFADSEWASPPVWPQVRRIAGPQQYITQQQRQGFNWPPSQVDWGGQGGPVEGAGDELGAHWAASGLQGGREPAGAPLP